MSGKGAAGAPAKEGETRTIDQKVVEEFSPLIRHLAHRLAFRLPPSMGPEDLFHAGILGLIDAFGKFDPSREIRFRTYAEYRIRGAMLDEIRSQNWIPRSVQEKFAALQKTRESLTRSFGREPTGEELAKALALGAGELDSLLAHAQAQAFLSLDELGLEGEEKGRLAGAVSGESGEDPLLSLLSRESSQNLVEAITQLPDKEKQVIALYYQEELNMKEIGNLLGVSESRVCQLHGQALRKLKQDLKKTE
jgi:RNA polymerase sigma factor for flagellar operon FliA